MAEPIFPRLTRLRPGMQVPVTRPAIIDRGPLVELPAFHLIAGGPIRTYNVDPMTQLFSPAATHPNQHTTAAPSYHGPHPSPQERFRPLV